MAEPAQSAALRAPDAPILVTRGLSKVYRSGEQTVHALRGIDFAARPGEFIVILGPSGSGKSTFLNIVGGLDTASEGEVRFKDHQLAALGEQGLTQYRRDHVGFVFQFYNLVPSLTARENVELVTEIARHPMNPDEALGLVGLTARAGTFRPSCRAANSSAWPSPAPSPRRPSFCCATSRRARWTA